MRSFQSTVWYLLCSTLAKGSDTPFRHSVIARRCGYIGRVDTVYLRMIAAAHSILEKFTPDKWMPLDDPRGPRLLMSQGDTSYTVSLWDEKQAVDAGASDVASAVLRSVLPKDAPFTVPRTVVSQSFSAGELTDTRATLVVADPLPGIPVSTQDFVEQPSLIESLARTLAILHSCDAGAVADSGLVAKEPQETREQLLDNLDRAAGTRKVPTPLLERWERVLETASAWHFLPAPIHDAIDVDALRCDGAQIVALTDVHRLRVGDPAVDLAAAGALLSPNSFEAFLEHYATHREVDDPGLRQRIDLMNEFVMVELLLTAIDSGDAQSVNEAAHMLRDFAEVVAPDEVTHRPAEADEFRPASAGVAVSGTDSDSAENVATTDISTDAPTFVPSVGPADRPAVDPTADPDDEDSIPTNRIDT